ncbi:MAG: hypothetical protein E7362_03215 [Clostridiales bacterium]|nr:hypothetical protein [Clostridiales bacterium]
MKSRKLAISAISASIIALILTLGAYVEVTDVFCVILSSIFVILPIYYKSYVGCFLTYLAGGVLAFMFSGFNVFSIVFPSYFAFFGIFPIVKCIMADKNFNKWFGIIIGAIWCVASAYGLYFYYTAVMGLNFINLPEWIANNILYFVGALGIVFYVLFDRFIYFSRIAIDRYLGRIVK